MSDQHDPEFENMLAKALGTTADDQIDRAIAEEIVPDTNVPPGHKSGYVAVIGKPNVGKSTLMNQLLGEKVAIVSPKPQTTRIRQLGIMTREDAQIIFVDTPGIHRAQDELGGFMVEVAKAALEDADVILFLTDASESPNATDRQVAEYVNHVSDHSKVIHVLNKVDAQPKPDKFQKDYDLHRALMPDAELISTVATQGHNVPLLLEKILERLPEGPRYYPPDQVSDLPMRSIVGEMIREQILKFTYQEIPYAIAVEVEQFKQRKAGLIYIAATIYTERESQKKIIIGKKGDMLKQISSAARQDIETFLESKVFLEMWVKVLTDWRRDPEALKRFGYKL